MKNTCMGSKASEKEHLESFDDLAGVYFLNRFRRSKAIGEKTWKGTFYGMLWKPGVRFINRVN